MRKTYLAITLALLFYTGACASAPTQNGAQSNSNISSSAAAQTSSDRGLASLPLEGGTVSVEYGRPALRGRSVEKLISPGQEWRMGSNSATTLSTDVDLKFGDKLVPKGTYVLKARLNEEQKWHLLVLKQDETPVTEIPLSLQKLDNAVELMTIELKAKSKGGTFNLQWGELMLWTDFEKA